MSHRILSRSNILLSSAAVAVAALALAAAAQTDSKGSIENLDKGRRENSARFEKLVQGKQPPAGAEDTAAADAYARWFIHQMTIPSVQTKRTTGSGSALHDLAREFDRQVRENVKGFFPANQAFVKIFTTRVIAAFRDVFGLTFNSNRVAVVNTALLLPIYAKSGDSDFATYLEELLKDEKQHPVVKLYAVKGLREYFSKIQPWKKSFDPADKRLVAQLKIDSSRLETVLKFIERKDKMDDDALRFIRREAIHTLALAGAPAMKTHKDGKVEVAAALTLLRALAGGKDGLSPAPSLTERAEAAIGVCKFKTKELDDYQPEAGIYLVGQFLLDFAAEYRKDYGSFVGKKEDRKIPKLPWKSYAERLETALKELKSNTPLDRKVADKLNTLLAGSKDILAPMSKHGPVEEPRGLRAVVKTLAPESGALFRGNKDLKINLGAGAEGE